MSKFLSRADFAKTKGRRYKDVEVPDLGKVRLQSLNGKEMGAVKSATVRAVTLAQGSDRNKAKAAMALAQADTIIACLVDPEQNNSPLFDKEDRHSIVDWDSSVLEFLDSEIGRFLGLDDLTIENAGKKSTTASGESSPTASPSKSTGST